MPVDPLSYVLVEGEPPADGQPLQPPAAAAAAEPPPAPLPSRPCSPARYTRSLLRQALQLMGLKPRQSDKAAQKAFLILQQRAALPPGEPLSLAARRCAAPGGHAGVTLTRAEFNRLVIDCLASPATAATEGAFAAQLAAPAVAPANQQQAALAEAAQQATAAAQPSPTQQQQQAAAAQHAPAPLPPAPDPLTDFRIACSLREQRASVAVLLCGTSGTGKSTLAALLAARLGISTVVSTDSIRHMMRSFCSQEEDPLLWASTYEAGSVLQQLAATALGGAPGGANGGSGGSAQAAGGAVGAAAAAATAQRLLARYGCPPPPGWLAGDSRKAAVGGYKVQSCRVLEHVDRLLAGCEARRQSVVIEGVHLSLSMVVRLMARHPSAVPFLVHISNESKHMERFAVRSKVMTLRPDGNRYVKYFRNIRAIQDYLGKSADKHAIPKVDNTNVDRSVATIHATLLGSLRRTARGESVLSGGPSLSCKLLLEEYLRCQSATWSSSDMLELLRRRSAAGEAPSPSEDAASTVTAPATQPATSPKGPLSEAAAEEVWLGSRRGSSGPLVLRKSGEGWDVARPPAPAPAAPAAKAEAEAETDEGDNRSFYDSDSQSSSQEGEGSSSCSCSGSDSEMGSAGEAAGRRGDGSHAQQRRGGSLPRPDEHHADEGLAGGPGLVCAHRRRDRRRLRRGGGGGGGGGSLTAEIPAGPVPERQRRRSEVGSVLEPEPHSDTEDAEVLAAPSICQ